MLSLQAGRRLQTHPDSASLAHCSLQSKQIQPTARMGNKAGKNSVSAEDMEFLMSQVQDKSLGTKSTFYRLNFTDSGHTKERIKVINCVISFCIC